MSARLTVCAVTPAERGMRVVLSLITAAIAVSMWPVTLWCAIPAAICSTFLMIGAVTGWCPTQLVPGARPAATTPENTLGIPEARAHVTIER